jgi:hypothetical protein
MKTCGRVEVYSSIFYFGTVWGWAVNYMPCSLYLWYPLGGRPGGPQNHSGPSGVEKNLLPLLAIKSQPSSLWPIPVLTELSPLSFKMDRTYVRSTHVSQMCSLQFEYPFYKCVICTFTYLISLIIYWCNFFSRTIKIMKR